MVVVMVVVEVVVYLETKRYRHGVSAVLVNVMSCLGHSWCIHTHNEHAHEKTPRDRVV